jgi:bacillithiol synthase
MRRHPVPYPATRRFAPIVNDYLAAAPALSEMYRFRPDANGLTQAIRERTFSPQQRAILCAALKRQYEGIAISPETRANLEALAQDKTFTITTGHQLCLFTGPLYTPFKILNVIRLAKTWTTADRRVVPVFWMASEDHDRPEIDHAWINGTKLHWPGTNNGAVGRMRLQGITAVLDAFDRAIGPGEHAEELRALVRSCYREEHTLAHATRLFVNALFGRFGLVIIDGDDLELKRSFAPVMQEELLNQVTARTVRYANEKLSGHYPEQAHVRDINLFHLREVHRSRIELQDDRYQVLDGGPSWSLDELLVQLHLNPHHFSPNVLLRPAYQETILPNIAYVGGGGEVAYWLQLRWLFQGLQVPMPAVVLRTSAAFISEKDMTRWEGLGLRTEDLFADISEVHARVAREHAGFQTDLGQERNELIAHYDALAARMSAADATLEGAVRARQQKAMNGLDALEKKLVRAAKRQQHELLDRVSAVQEHLFPGGGLLERRENFASYFAREGQAFFDELLAQLDPLDPTFSILER